MSDVPPPIYVGDEGDKPGNARLHVHLVFIFLYIIGALDFLMVPAHICYAVFFPTLMAQVPAAGPPPPPMFNTLLVITYSVLSVFALLQGILMMIAATKLRRLSPGAWGWGLAAAIGCCASIQCSLFCILPLAAGIYMIVVLCKENVRRYVRSGGVPAEGV